MFNWYITKLFIAAEVNVLGHTWFTISNWENDFTRKEEVLAQKVEFFLYFISEAGFIPKVRSPRLKSVFYTMICKKKIFSDINSFLKNQLQPLDDKIYLENRSWDFRYTEWWWVLHHVLYLHFVAGHRLTDRPPIPTHPNLPRSLEVQRNAPGVETLSTQPRRSWGQARWGFHLKHLLLSVYTTDLRGCLHVACFVSDHSNPKPEDIRYLQMIYNRVKQQIPTLKTVEIENV